MTVMLVLKYPYRYQSAVTTDWFCLVLWRPAVPLQGVEIVHEDLLDAPQPLHFESFPAYHRDNLSIPCDTK